jgi:hypothetical protein
MAWAPTQRAVSVLFGMARLGAGGVEFVLGEMPEKLEER